MKTMFVGGKLHARLLEIPRGSEEYRLPMIEGELTYRPLHHPQVFTLVEYNGKSCGPLPVDYYMNPRIYKWIKLVTKQSSQAVFDSSTQKKGSEVLRFKAKNHQ